MPLGPNPRAVVTGAGGGLGRARCREIELAGSGVRGERALPDLLPDRHRESSRLSGPPERLELVRGFMAGARIQADAVARIAFDGVARDVLYILPHPDGRWAWRLKRLAPGLFFKLTPKLLALGERARRA